MKRAFQRIKGKSTRDFIVYGKRILYLESVKYLHAKYGEDYFYSDVYLKKHIEGGITESLINTFQKSTVGLFGDIEDLRDRLAELSVKSPNITDEIIDYANVSVSHRFDLLGSGLVDLTYPAQANGIWGTLYDFPLYSEPKRSLFAGEDYCEIDWHYDFKSGYRWNPGSYYPEARVYAETPGADIKVVWELSRCQHLPMVGLAYLLTGESAYPDEIYAQIIDWIDNNPLCKGPNWNCPMDVGIRVSNWLVALELIRSYRHKDNMLRLKKIIASLIQHLDYLWNNFEWTSKLTSNHYLSDIAGFLYCVAYIPNLKRKYKYINFLKKEFNTEIVKQMYSDGMNSEGSLPYHRLVLELFSYSALLAQRNGFELSQEFYEQLSRSFDFTSVVMKNDFTLPQIGDNDGGVFLRFFPRELTDFSYLLTLGECVCQQTFGEFNQSCGLEYALFDVSSVKVPPVEKVVKCFKESGISVFKNDKIYFSFYHGLNGQKGNGGHCHNDRLSFTLSYMNNDLFTDPGTGIYTASPEIRNKFRSTSSHNTVEIDECEQNTFRDDGYLFSVNEDISVAYARMFSDSSIVRFEASHNGYNKLYEGINHKRNIDIDEKNNVIFIKDQFDTIAIKKAWFVIKKHEKLIVDDKSVRSRFMSVEFYGADSVTIEDFDSSTSYGKVDSATCVRVCVRFVDRLTTKIELL